MVENIGESMGGSELAFGESITKMNMINCNKKELKDHGESNNDDNNNNAEPAKRLLGDADDRDEFSCCVEDDDQEITNNKNNHEQRKYAPAPSSQEQEPDLSLVAELRARLRLEIEARPQVGHHDATERDAEHLAQQLDNNDENNENNNHPNSHAINYSKHHYEELMDDSNPWPCWRYLLHTQLKVDDALALALQTLEWRHANQVDPPHLDWNDPEYYRKNDQMIKELWHMSAIVRCGQDLEGNSVYCVVGRNYRKPDSSLKQVTRQFVSNMLFEWDRRNSRNLRKLTLIFDVSDTGYQNIDLDYMAWMISIRDFLPARIMHIYVIGVPFLLRPLVRLIIGWLPEKFSSILECGSWDELVRANMRDNEIPCELGGSRPDERLAPKGALWMNESAFYENQERRDAIEWCIGFACDEETRARRRQAQVEFEQVS